MNTVHHLAKESIIKAVVTAIAIIAESITTTNTDTIGSIEAKVNHHLAETARHESETSRYRMV